MTIQLNKATACVITLGASRTGWTVSYRVLYSNLSVKTNWTSTGIVEIGYGAYGVVLTVDEIMGGYIQWRAEYSGLTTIYSTESLNVTVDYISNITNILKIEQGKWEILNNQMLFYDTNGIDVLYRFNLYDTNGDPTEIDITKREPV